MENIQEKRDYSDSNAENKEYKVTDIEEIKRRLAREFGLEEIKEAEKIIEDEEEKAEKELNLEKEKAIIEELEQEAVKIRTIPQVQDEVQKKSQDIKNLTAEGKLRGLLNLAQTKGVSFALVAAQSMNDPYILDIFHDLLIKDGLHKKFSK